MNELAYECPASQNHQACINRLNSACHTVYQSINLVGLSVSVKEKNNKKSRTVARKPRDAACHLPHHYSTRNIGMTPSEHIGASLPPGSEDSRLIFL